MFIIGAATRVVMYSQQMAVQGTTNGLAVLAGCDEVHGAAFGRNEILSLTFPTELR
jgi:hypothetical protein